MNIFQKLLAYIGILSRDAVEASSDEPSEITISITTTNKYIICRAWEWDKTSQPEIERLKKELLLLKLVSERDQKQAMFFSKYSLPNDLKLWLTQHEIPFKED